MTKARLLAAACAVLATAPAIDASAFCRTTLEGDCDDPDGPTEIGEPFEWDQACISYAIDSRGSQWMSDSELEEVIDLAFEEWENADCGGEPPNVVFKPLQSSTCQRREFNCEGNVNTIAFLNPWQDVCTADQFTDVAFAITVVWHDPNTGEILDTDMLINDELAGPMTAGGPYANCPDDGCPPAVGGPGVADLRSIVTHEIGHMLGIGHSPVEEATMFAVQERRSVDNRDLHPDDVAAVCTIYPPGQLDQSCDATPFGGLELDCEQKACSEEGCRVSSGSGGCAASGDPADAPWPGIFVAIVGLIALRRRPRFRGARS